MKKSNLLTGIIFTLIGVIFFCSALYTESRLDGLLWGWFGAFFASGVLTICRYFYWRAPERQPHYQERLDLESIEQNDELKKKLRDESGRYAYLLGLAVICVSLVIFSVMGVWTPVFRTQTIVLYLGACLLFQIVVGIVIFNHLSRKY